MAEPFGQTRLKRVVVRVENCFANVGSPGHACEGESLREIFIRGCCLPIDRILRCSDKCLIELITPGQGASS